jgi:hypothetical protein
MAEHDRYVGIAAHGVTHVKLLLQFFILILGF